MTPTDARRHEDDRPGGRPEWEDLVYTGPGTLAGRYLRIFWQPVYVAEDLPVGRPKPVRIMNEDFTLYRGESGMPHAIAFRCAHRGTQLSTGWVEGDDLRCFYHGWKYDETGQCIEQPAEPEPFCERVRIRSYPTREYLGLIFLYMGSLGEGEPPEFPRYPEFEADDQRVVLYNTTYTWSMNYFNSLENDPYHGLWVHRDSYTAAGRVKIPKVTCEETDYGYVTYATRPNSHTTVTHRLMPNASYGRRTRISPDGLEGYFEQLGGGWRNALAWRVPVDDAHMATFSINAAHLPDARAAERYREIFRGITERAKGLIPAEQIAAAVLRGEIRIEDVDDRFVDGNRLFNIQDYVSQVGQGAIADREHEHLGQEDATLIFQRNIFRRELQALAEGRPLKQWRRPVAELPVGDTRSWS